MIVAADAASVMDVATAVATTSAADAAKSGRTAVEAISAKNAVPPMARRGPSATPLHAMQRRR